MNGTRAASVLYVCEEMAETQLEQNAHLELRTVITQLRTLPWRSACLVAAARRGLDGIAEYHMKTALRVSHM
jgi:hypothetical protein